MFETSYDFKAFYNSREGRVVRRVVKSRIENIWPDCNGLNVMGCGYAGPYMRVYKEKAQSLCLLMPAGKGAHNWPPDSKNAVFLAEAEELPIETNSVDRIVMIHDLEFAEVLQPKLQEIWRVLKSNGRILIIVPNRSGFWARADWSPFGHGTPYSLGQIRHHLRENMFVEEQTQEALFMPPLRTGFILKGANMFENIGQKLPIGAGLHMVEASKQLYARATPSSGSKMRVRSRGALSPTPNANAFKSESSRD